MPITQTAFETRHVEEAESFFAGAYDMAIRIEAPADSSWRYHRLDTGRFAIDSVSAHMDLAFEGCTANTITVCEILGGRVEQSSEGKNDRLESGDVFLPAMAADVPHQWWTHSLDVRTTTVDIGLLTEVLGIPPEDPSPRIRFLAARSRSVSAGTLWKRTLNFAFDLLDDQSRPVPQLMVDTFARSFASMLLSVFPHDIDLNRHHDSHDSHPAALRRAVAFIESNAHRDISLSDIVGSANVGPRAVQLAFRRHLDTTPMGYVRRVRLAHAHSDLKTGDPGRETVRAVARRWGFAEFSQFERMYWEVYGVLPTHTLNMDT